MKKTLVALAAVAVAGGAFAQATMTGAVAWGFESDTSSSNVTTSGFGLEDAEINFATSEAIEGVGTISAGLGFGYGGKGSALTGNDTNLTLALANGMKITMKSAKGAEYLTGGVAGVGANFEADLTYTGLLSRTSNDSVSVALPVAEGMTLTLTNTEADVAIASGSAAAAATTPVQRYNTGALLYKVGGLTVDGQYRSYDNQVANSSTSANTKNRLSASYDLGAAKIGAGVDTTQYTYGNTKTATLVGLNIPMGALSLGAQAVTVTASGNSSASSNYTRTGALAGGMYSLSKRTYVTAQYWTGDVGGTSNATGYLFSLYNTF